MTGRGRTGSGGRTGLTGSPLTGRGRTGSGGRSTGSGRVGRDGLTASERSAYRRGMRAAGGGSGAGRGPGASRGARVASRMSRTRSGRAALATGRGIAATGRGIRKAGRWGGRGVDRMSGHRLSRRWKRMRARLPARLRRFMPGNLLAADQAFTAEVAGLLAPLLARLWKRIADWAATWTRLHGEDEDVDDKVEPGEETGGGRGYEEGPSMRVSARAARVMDAADELRQALADYGSDSTGMLDYGQGLSTIPYAFDQVKQGLQAMAVDALGTRPVDAEVVQFLLDLAATQGAMQAKAEELQPLFAYRHEADILRLTGGRPNEHLWDATANR